jgi:acyl-CoA synthetase (AMP-forming)/AMP-acid ligase II
MTGSEVEQMQSNRELILPDLVNRAAKESPREWLLVGVKEARKNESGIAMESREANRKAINEHSSAQILTLERELKSKERHKIIARLHTCNFSGTMHHASCPSTSRDLRN